MINLYGKKRNKYLILTDDYIILWIREV